MHPWCDDGVDDDDDDDDSEVDVEDGGGTEDVAISSGGFE